MNTDEIKKLIQSNSNYWEKRALENKLNIIENEIDYFTRLESIYKEANKQIDEKMALIYQRYAEENKLTMKQAYKQLPAKIEKQYKDDVNTYIAQAKAYGGDGKWRQYLLNQSLMHQHSVLDQMRTEYRNVVYNIDMENTGGKFLAKIYQNANYYAQYTSDSAKVNNNPFNMVSQDRIQSLLEENWSGAGNFSQLIWKNREMLVQALDEIVIKGLAVGNSFEIMSKQLAERMGTSFKSARRLIMTESARMDNQGLLDHYKDTGVEQFIFVATLDEKTSEICRSMDGLIFDIKDAQIGLNVPPLHPYCRSVISPYYEFNKVEERIYKDAYGRNKTGTNRTYDKYLEEEMADINGAKAIVSQRNSISNLVMATGTLMDNKMVPISPTTNINKDVTITNPNVQPLNNEEVETLNRMVSGSSWVINDNLRRDLDLTEEQRRIMSGVDKALKKLPIYQGEVKRDIDVPALEDFIKDYEVDKVITFKQFLSASTKKKQTFNKNPNVIYSITSKTGRDIRKYNKKEAEILFERKSRFLIKSVNTKKNKVYIDMEQLI